MRILHTSDWHLGRTLEGRSRLAEQAEFVDELCEVVEREGAQLVLVAGDVFDTCNPSAEAEELFYDCMERLAAGGERGVVVIAGNHDSPDRLRAAGPLAVKHGISLVGYPAEELACTHSAGRVASLGAGRGWLEIAVPGCDETAVIYTVAYPSEARLNKVLTESLEGAAQQEAYVEHLRTLFSEAEAVFRPDTVNLMVGHLFVAGGWECDSERQIQLGGALIVEPQALPALAQYIALGHLHRPQAVNQSPAPCRYSGSPLAYSFSEADQQKEVVLVDVSPGGETCVTQIKLTCGRPLKKWTAENLEEVYRLCQEPKNLESWVDLEVGADQPLTAAQVAELRKTHPGIVGIRVRLPETVETAEERRLSELSLAEQFELFALRQRGAAPSPELRDLFLELVNTAEGEREAGENAVAVDGEVVA